LAEFWVDYVKVYEYLGGAKPIHLECRAKDTAEDDVLCSSSNWACYEQDYAPNMDVACNENWQKCCIDWE